MKKLLMLIIVFVAFYLVGSRFVISNNIYVCAIYIDYNDKYELTMLCPSASSVGSKDKQDISSSLIKCEGNSLDEAFNEAATSSVLTINYRHIVSIVFNINAFNKRILDEFNRFISNNSFIDFNFYVFTTSKKGDELFSFKNPDDVSSYFSVLNLNALSRYLYTYASPIHYVEFLKRYSDNETINLPYIEINENYIIEDKTTKNIFINGITSYYEGKTKITLKEDNPYLFLLNEFTEGSVYIDKYDAIIKRNTLSYKYNDKLIIKIKIKYKGLLNLDNTLELREFLLMKLDDNINYLLKNDIDYLNLKYINDIYKKNYTYQDIKFKILLNKM